mgnify:CR=1 FL=1
MEKIWVKKSKSFKSASRFDIDYYLSKSSSERLEAMQFLRDIFYNFKKGTRYGKGRKGLRRVIKII